ncbi:iron uptake porin [Myxosarcina sp. GI1]|uniref:iron uptake porin n=1 Tax=Myxosarcina sp. GI1 TaxID=1541065 RepID=UPI0012E00BCE|nr:iron uptake porin [Myxosarcina sp. GI1]
MNHHIGKNLFGKILPVANEASDSANIVLIITNMVQIFFRVPTKIAIFCFIFLAANNSVKAQNLEQNNFLALPNDLAEVERLRDVNPEDWAYEALRNLSDRYNCLDGYPDATYRGNAAMSRYEFAVALSSCLQSIRKLVTSGQIEITQEDLATIARLQKNYSAELTKLDSRIDKLETNIGQLEDTQFSTTTKLLGNLRVQANTFVSGDGEPQTNIQYNLFLGQLTSFTGRDFLLAALGATNTTFPELASNNNGIDFGSTREGASDTAGSGSTFGSVRLIGLEYQFPVGERIVIDVVAANRYRFSPILLPQFFPGYTIGQGPVSTFAEAPPIYLLGAGSGLSVSYEFIDSAVLTLTYLGTFANDPQAGRGWFNGDYIAAAQINYNPSPDIFLQFLYQKGYFDNGNFGFNNGQTFRGNGFVGTSLANRFDDPGVFFDEGAEVLSNAYQIGGYYTISEGIIVGGWANLIKARLLGKGDADIWTYSLQTAFPDLFIEGNQGGIVVGVEPTLTGLDSSLEIPEFKNDTSLHLEVYYRHQLNDYISVTPSVIWITAPNQDANNEDIIIGGVRTTFNF